MREYHFFACFFLFFGVFPVHLEQGGGWDTTAYNIAELKNENCPSTSCGSRLFNIISTSGTERRQPFCLFFSRTRGYIMLNRRFLRTAGGASEV